MNAFSHWESCQRIGACRFPSVLEKHTAAQRQHRGALSTPVSALGVCFPSACHWLVSQITCVAYQWSAVADPSWLGAQRVMRIDVTANSCVFHPRFVFHLTAYHSKVYSSRWQATLCLFPSGCSFSTQFLPYFKGLIKFISSLTINSLSDSCTYVWSLSCSYLTF